MNYPIPSSWERFKRAPTIVIILIHIAAVAAAPFTFTWLGLAVAITLFWVTGGLGITLGFHRLFTHRSFQTFPIVRHTLAFFGVMALQGGPLSWIAYHRLHHAESDEEPDPHTPFVNFIWAHVLWNFFEHPALRTREAIEKYTRDFSKDRMMRFYQRYFFFIYLAVAGALFGIGWLLGGATMGASFVVWGVLVRTVMVWHATWFVNSATHIWGYKNYETGDNSRNNWWVALITFGEGWHNNHHADQVSARHGHRWYEIDQTWITIWLMEKLGLAWEIKHPRRLALKPNAEPLDQTETTPFRQ